MDAAATQCQTCSAGPQPARLRLSHLAFWPILCIVAGILVAWAAEVAQGYRFAPKFLLFPLLVGAVFGGTVVALVRLSHVGHYGTVLLGAALGGCVTVAAQHYAHYRTMQRRMEQQPEKLALRRMGFPELVPPPDFLGYMRWSAAQGRTLVGGLKARDEMAWLSWGVDGLLTLFSALVLVHTAARLPFCNQCGKWYQTVRSGRIDPQTARRLAALLDVAVAGQIGSARCRMIDCPGGCGPAGVSLYFKQPDGDYAAGPIWLDRSRRDQLQRLLDEVHARTEQQETAGQDRPRQTNRIEL